MLMRVAGLILVGLFVAHPELDAAERPPSPAKPQRMSRLEGWVVPQTGEALSTFEPIEERSDRDRRKSEALARYLSGRIALDSGRNLAAIEAFRKAIELDPSAISPYKALLPVLLTQRKIDEARDLVLESARKTDQGFELVVVMASVFVRQSQFDQGIALLQDALHTRSVPDGSQESLLLHRELGLYHRLNNDFDKAADEYEFVFQAVTEGDLDAAILSVVLNEPGKNFDEFGDTFLKAGKPELALKAYEEASKHRDAKPGLHSFNLATVFQQTGKPEQALQSLQQYFDAKLHSRGRAPYLMLQELLEELEKGDEFLPRLEALLAKDESNDVLRYFVADQFLANGDIDRAEEMYVQGREMLTDPRALVGMVAISRERSNAEKLLEMLTKSFQVVPRADNEETLKRLDEDLQSLSRAFESQLDLLKKNDELMVKLFDYARSLKQGDDPKLDFIQAYLIGKLATEGDYSDAAIEFYRDAIGMRNEPPAQLYTELATHLLDSDRHAQAVEVLQEALNHPANTLQSERWRFLFFLSYGFEFLGETEKALEAVQDAIGAAPDVIHGRLEYQRAWVFYHARQWENALKQFETVIARYAEDTKLVQDSKFRISSIYVEQGEQSRGEAVLLDVLKEDPENTQANNDLGYLWADQGINLDRAFEMITKAVTADPENPAYLDSLGWVLYRLERYEEAVEHLERASQMKNGEDSTIFDHLGDALLKVNRPAEAIKSFERALELEEKKKHPSEKMLNSLREKLMQPAN